MIFPFDIIEYIYFSTEFTQHKLLNLTIFVEDNNRLAF